jgi:AcrR family transcriptional regulator
MTEHYETPTRAALIESAGEVFAEVGFEAASIRSICARAGANIAAVHYHFGTKAALYEAVCDQLFPALPLQEKPKQRPRSRSAGARGVVEALVETLFSQDETWRTRIVRRELMAPTPAVTRVIARAMAPRWARLEKALGQIEPTLSLRERRCQLAALIGELLFLRDARPLLEAMHGRGSWSFARDVLTERITAGLLSRLEA